MHIKQLLRSSVEHFPILTNFYRIFRDELYFYKKKAVLTPFGFWLSGDRSMETGLFEPDETAIIRECLVDIDVFVDVGANVGYYSLLAKSKGKKVISVEPHPTNLRSLFKNIELNSFKDIEVWPIALAQSPGSMTLWGGGTGASLVEGWAGISKLWKQIVSVNTLDNILGNRFTREKLFIKVDVEGAEFDVLQGATATLQREPQPIWLVEVTLLIHHPGVNQNFGKIFRVFWENGYSAYTGNMGKKIVTEADIERWESNEVSNIECINWMFVPNPVHSLNEII